MSPDPKESEGIPDSVCDVPLCNNPTPLNAPMNIMICVVNSDDENSSRDYDSPYGENIDYGRCITSDVEDRQLRGVEIVIRKWKGLMMTFF
ncbi:hypothetical protein Tco_0222110 [Tanacetum coccineum]